MRRRAGEPERQRGGSESVRTFAPAGIGSSPKALATRLSSPPPPRTQIRPAMDPLRARGCSASISFAESSFFPIPPGRHAHPDVAGAAGQARLWLRRLVCTTDLGRRRRASATAIGALLYDYRSGLWLISALRLRRQGRGVPRSLCGMGRLDHSAQGPDADPVQDRHHRVRLRRLQPARCSSCCRSIARGGRLRTPLAFLLHRYGPIRPAPSSRSGSASG